MHFLLVAAHIPVSAGYRTRHRHQTERSKDLAHLDHPLGHRHRFLDLSCIAPKRSHRPVGRMRAGQRILRKNRRSDLGLAYHPDHVPCIVCRNPDTRVRRTPQGITIKKSSQIGAVFYFFANGFAVSTTYWALR